MTLPGATGTSAELLEFVGMDFLSLKYKTLIGGNTTIRLNDCNEFLLGALNIYGQERWADSASPSHGIQLINSSGLVADTRIVADQYTEDHLNIYGDKPETEKKLVHIQRYRAYGRGVSLSGCGITIDGPHPPVVIVEDFYLSGNRCGSTVAAGSGAVFRRGTVLHCGTDLYIYRGYPNGTPPNRITLDKSGFHNILNEVKGSVVSNA